MTIKELTNEFEKFKEETLASFKKLLGLVNKSAEELKPKKELTIWKPKDGEKYYFIDLYGNVDNCMFNAGDSFDSQMMAIGNVYQIKEDAERFALINRFSNLYRKYVEEHSKELCWNNFQQDKWYAYYDHRNDKIDISCDYEGKCQGIVYADTKQTILDAINFVGEKNMLKYVFEVIPDEDYMLPL